MSQKSKLWVLPLEPLEMRYTIEWRIWFKEILLKHGIDYYFVDGNALTNRIENGEVLDVYGTNYWKLTQLAGLVNAMRNGDVKDGDKIFTFDMWHTGIEVIQYIKSMTGKKLDLYGIWHAGSYDHSDFTYRHGFEPWAFKLEQTWGKIATKMFVGSVYHQKMIKHMRGIDTIVTGLPIDINWIREKGKFYKSHKKKDQIVFTSRLDPEKRPDLFKKLKQMCKGKKWDWVVTQEQKMSKELYYATLAESKVVVSTAEHENFGIGVMEAMALGCIPVVPNGLSYVDYVPEAYRYKTLEEAKKLIQYAINVHMDNYTFNDTIAENIQKYENSFKNMLKEMGYANSR